MADLEKATTIRAADYGSLDYKKLTMGARDLVAAVLDPHNRAKTQAGMEGARDILKSPLSPVSIIASVADDLTSAKQEDHTLRNGLGLGVLAVAAGALINKYVPFLPGSAKKKVVEGVAEAVAPRVARTAVPLAIPDIATAAGEVANQSIIGIFNRFTDQEKRLVISFFSKLEMNWPEQRLRGEIGQVARDTANDVFGREVSSTMMDNLIDIAKQSARTGGILDFMGGVSFSRSINAAKKWGESVLTASAK